MSEQRYQTKGSLSAEERAAMVLAVEEQAREIELAHPDGNLTGIGRKVNAVAEAIGVATLSVIVLIIFINATLRYTMSTSMIWGDELVISLIPLMAFTGLFLSVRRGRFIRIDTLVTLFPQRMQMWVYAIGQAVSGLAFAYLAFYGYQYLALFGGDQMVYFDMPKGVLQSAICIGAAAVSAGFFANAWRTLRIR